jgi:hypothetical protein
VLVGCNRAARPERDLWERPVVSSRAYQKAAGVPAGLSSDNKKEPKRGVFSEPKF